MVNFEKSEIMNKKHLDLKFGIGEEVYVVFKERTTVEVLKGKIEEISYSLKCGLHYYLDIEFDEFKEDEIIAVNDKEGLIKKIDELLESDEENE